MSLTKRYGLLALMLICFQALFFVPVFFAPSDLSGVTTSGTAQLLLGGSPFLLHYQSLGLFPIVLGGLSVTLLPMIDSRIEGRHVNEFKDALTYLFGLFVSIGIVHRSSMSWEEWRSYVVIVELVGSLQIIMMIVKFVEKLEIASSPVTVFFAWNVITAAFSSGYSMFSAVEAELWIIGLFSLALMLFTLYCSHHFLTAQRDISIVYVSPLRGYQVADRIKKKAAQVSIMPVVVVMLGLGSIGEYFFDTQPNIAVLHSPWYLMIFLAALWFMSRTFSVKKNDISRLFSHIESMGGKVANGNRVEMDTHRTLKKWLNNRVWEQWFVLALFIVSADLVNMWFIGVGLPPVTYVAGLGMWLLVNAFLDMRKQYDKLIYIYL